MVHLGPMYNNHVTCFSALDKLKLELTGEHGLSMAVDTFLQHFSDHGSLHGVIYIPHVI